MRKIKLLTLLTLTLSIFIISCNKDQSKSEKFKVDPKPVMEQAIKQNNYLMLVFESESCRYCTKLNKEVLSDINVKEKMLKNKVSVAIVNVYGKRDVFDPESKNDMNEQILSYIYKVQVFPTIAIFDPNNNYKLLWKFTGYIPKENFVNLLDYLGTACYQKIPFEKFMDNGKKC